MVVETSEPMLQWFKWDHLPEHLQDVSRKFAVLANELVTWLPRTTERTVALRKLLESKDAAVRCRIELSDRNCRIQDAMENSDCPKRGKAGGPDQ